MVVGTPALILQGDQCMRVWWPGQERGPDTDRAWLLSSLCGTEVTFPLWSLSANYIPSQGLSGSMREPILLLVCNLASRPP